MDDAAIRRVLEPAGRALLGGLPPYREDAAMSAAQGLRDRGVDADLAAAVLTQSRLRARGRAKFGGDAGSMLFTPEGLEQATRPDVAAHHAHRLTGAGCARVADLGCGIGADAMAFAGAGLGVLAVDRDPASAAAATANLRRFPGARVRCEDLTTTALDDVDAIFCDPSRRDATGRRVLDPRRASPPWDVVLGLVARVPAAGVKVAPGIRRDLAPGAEVQWVSVDGDVVEAGVWFGTAARAGVARSALVLRGGQAHVLDDGMAGEADVGPVGAHLYAPDGAVVRAGLVAELAAAVGGRLVDPTIAYVTADRHVPTPFARVFAVDDAIPFSLKVLRARLRERGVGRVEILQRGSAVDVEQLRQRLRLHGDGGLSLVLTRVAGRHSVLLCHPLPR